MVGVTIDSATVTVNDDLEALARARYAHCHQLRILHHIKMRDDGTHSLQSIYGASGADNQRHGRNNSAERGLVLGPDGMPISPRQQRRDQSLDGHGHGTRGSHSHLQTGHDGNARGHQHDPHHKHPHGNDPGGGGRRGSGEIGGGGRRGTGEIGGGGRRDSGEIGGKGHDKHRGKGSDGGKNGFNSPSQSTKSILRKRSGSDGSAGSGAHSPHGHHNEHARAGPSSESSRAVSGATTAAPSRINPRGMHDPGSEESLAAATAAPSIQSLADQASTIWRDVSRRVSEFTREHSDSSPFAHFTWRDWLLLYAAILATYVFFCCCSDKNDDLSGISETYDCII